MKRNYTFLALAITIILSGCAGIYRNRGDKAVNQLAYSKAIENYSRSLDRKDDSGVHLSLAHAYMRVNDVDNAIIHFEYALKDTTTSSLEYFNYGKLLMEDQKYSEAAVWLSRFLEFYPDDVVGRVLLASCNSVDTFRPDTTLFSLERIEMGEVRTMFAGLEHEGGIVFAADKEAGKKRGKNPWTGGSYLDLYFSEKDPEGKWIQPRLLNGDINGQYHEGPATFNREGTEVYFTRSNYYKKKRVKSSKNENNLKIFKAYLVDGEWTHLSELPVNSDDYSCGHPSLASDGYMLYFVSDMPGGYGGTDIYYIAFNGTDWSQAVNLGEKVNTPGNEMFPYIHHDGSLYFASDGHSTMGGLDVFVTSHTSEKGWLQPENLNYPVNSSRDDFAFILNQDDSTGYISSARTKTDQVYKFTRHAPTFILEGLVSNSETGQPLKNSLVTISSGSGDRRFVRTDGKGNYKISLKPQSDYSVIASEKGFFSLSRKTSTMGKKHSENFRLDFSLAPMEIEKPIVLENIYFDLDKWEIRGDAATELDKLVKVLNDNPDIYIEMSAHTDSRAGDQYNLILSGKRAKATVDYLIHRGIDPGRLSWKGYGETRLLNRCRNGVKCTDEEHQLNRRTEFRVIRIGSKQSVSVE